MKHRILQIYGAVTVLNVLLFAAIYMRSPEILIEEDMLLENLTASTFAMAAVIGLIMAIFHWRGNGRYAWLTLLVPFLAGLAALDEIRLKMTTDLTELQKQYYTKNHLYSVQLINSGQLHAWQRVSVGL